MARPTVIRNEVILEAARTVFLERGILATSAEVAQRAGVSEGSIFKRFKTKAELFRAAMGVDLEDVLPALRDLVSRVGTRSVEQNLVDAGIQTVVFFERVMPIVMMSWSNPKLPGCTHGYSSDPAPLRAQRFVADYLDAEARLGRIAPTKSEIIARAYLGALSNYVFSELLAQSTSTPSGTVPRVPGIGAREAPDAQPLIDRDDYVRGFVHALVRGMGIAEDKTVSRPRAIDDLSEMPHREAAGF